MLPLGCLLVSVLVVVVVMELVVASSLVVVRVMAVLFFLRAVVGLGAFTLVALGSVPSGVSAYVQGRKGR